jgi:hypothetical protein
LRRLLLPGTQIGCLVLVVQREEPDHCVGDQVIVDDPEASAFTLPPSLIRPAQLSKAAGSGHHLPCLGLQGQIELKLSILVVTQVVGQHLREYRRFD